MDNPVTKETFPDFENKLKSAGLSPLKPTGIDTLQINVGKMCNQTCKHCHVDAGPTRKEIMTKETMEACLEVIRNYHFKIVDITGGAPELNPNFVWLVEEISKSGVHIMVRCNLTIIVANKSYHSLPDFYKKHKVEVVASLPYFASSRTDAQRGDGVFDKSITALQMLNQVGYATDPELKLHLVYNPTGAFLPGDQEALEQQFKQRLKANFDIEFNELYTITNMPINRYLDYLHASGNYQSYMNLLVQSFNPDAAKEVMCRNMLSVGWNGMLYDCDFNQMLNLNLNGSIPGHISDFDWDLILSRTIKTGLHCYGCTAGSGSSCGGAIS